MKKNKLLRRLTAALLAAVLTLSIALPVFASDDSDTIYINSVSDLLSLAEVLLENRLALVFRQLDVIQRNADRRLRVVLIGIHRQPAVSGQGIAVLLRPFLWLWVVPVPDFIRDFSTACFHLQAVPGI